MIFLFPSEIIHALFSFFRFPICLGDVRVYTNEEQTRTFIGIVVTAGKETLIRLVQKLDEVLSDFKLPPFYEVSQIVLNLVLRVMKYFVANYNLTYFSYPFQEASFHLSIASCAGNHITSLLPHLPRLQASLDMFIHSQPLQWSFIVETLHFRTGNKYFSFKLM